LKQDLPTPSGHSEEATNNSIAKKVEAFVFRARRERERERERECHAAPMMMN
jgi:hypothetical protein